MNEDQKNILATIHSMTDAFDAKNIDGVMKAYERGAVVVFEPEKPISDRSAIEQMFQGAFSLNPKFTYSGHEVMVAGDVGVHFAPWVMKGKTPDGQLMEQSGLSVAVLRKQEDGNWLMVIDNPHAQHLLPNK